MDPITHTLTGAALARCGLNQRSAYATPALLIGANLPDIDGLAYFLGGADTALAIRRGWTHGLLALAVLPFLLWGSIWVVHRWRTRRGGDLPALHWGWLLAICYLGVCSHPLLDWLNNYGVRLLMPFDGRWFYGDSVFIVDPWIWLLLGGGLFLGAPCSWRMLILWLALGSFSTFLMLTAVPSSLWQAKAIWLTVLAGLAAARWRGWPPGLQSRRRLMRVAASLGMLYVALMLSSTRYARKIAAEELANRGLQVQQLMVAPLPVNPLRRDVVAATPQGYRFGELQLFPAARLRLNPRLIPLPRLTPAVRSALQAPQVQGMVGWARFPFVEVVQKEASCLVYLLDARYTRSRMVGFGGAVVEVSKPARGSCTGSEAQREGE